MLKKTIISPEFGLCKGGIQSWAFYMDKAFRQHDGTGATIIALRALRWGSFYALLKANFVPHQHFLMTWKMSVAVLLSLFLDLFRKKGARYHVFIHGNDILNLSVIQKLWIKRLLKNHRFSFIANSRAIAAVFKEALNHSVDIVIPPFVDVQGLLSLSRNKPPEAAERKEVFFFSLTRLVKRKNMHNVLYALSILKEEGLAFKYVIGGAGPEMDRLRSLTRKLGLERQVEFAGRITEEEKINMLNQCHFFLLPSVFDVKEGSIEGYGIVYIEANAFSVPVLAGDTGGATEAVIHGKTGLSCDGSVGDIKNQIKSLLETDFSRQTLINHALAHDYRNQTKFIEFITAKTA